MITESSSDDPSSDELANAILAAKPRAPERVIEALARLNVEQLGVAGQERGEPTVRDGLPWSQVGRYRLLERLGRGGMGDVWLGLDAGLGRRVALKQLRPRSADQTDRLWREAQALARLSHPNVVTVYSVEKDHEQLFIAMELVEGETLQQWQGHRPAPSWAVCVRAYVQAGRGLAAAHAAGLVHRDFKPSNCMIDRKGKVKVLDFGLVGRTKGDSESSTDGNVIADALATDPPHVDDALSRPLTQTGDIVGTKAYMAPEALAGASGSEHGDQFSFCVSLFEALYGQRPFPGDSLQELVASVKEGRVRLTPERTAVPESVRKVVLRGLATEPADRWPSMEALLDELRRQLARPARKRGGAALALAGGLVAVGGGIVTYVQVSQQCKGAREQLEGIWDEGRKLEVREAILGTGVPYAPDTWERVERRLDEYADAWADKRTEVCEATNVRQEQSAEAMDLRMECLRKHNVELREAVAVLAEADPSRVENAVELVRSLPGVSRCDDVEALQAELPPPDDPQVALRVESLRERLVQIQAQLKAGDLEEPLAEVEATVEQAEELSYVPLLAEALLKRAIGHHLAAHYEDAEADAERAYLLATEYGYNGVAAKAVALLVTVVGQKQERHESGLQWGKSALALARAQRLQPELEAYALNNIGNVLEKQGKLEEALAHHQHALPILEAAMGPRHPDVATSLGSIGNVLEKQGKLEEALTYQRHALAIREEALSPRHPDIGISFLSIGVVLVDQGKLEDALIHFQHALSIAEEAEGPRHHRVSLVLNNIGVTLQKQGKLEDSLIYLRRALVIKQETLGPRHPQVGQALNNIGLLLRNQGKLEEALDHCQRALTIVETAMGPRHPDVAYPLINLGAVLSDQGKWEEALDHLRRALAIREEALGPHHVHVAHVLCSMGRLLRKQGKLEEALTCFNRTLAIWEQSEEPHHPHVAGALLGLATTMLAKSDRDTAREHAERALSIFESSETSSDTLAEARFVLAQTLWSDQTQRGRAQALAKQALDAYSELGSAKQEDLAQVRSWLAGHRMR